MRTLPLFASALAFAALSPLAACGDDSGSGADAAIDAHHGSDAHVGSDGSGSGSDGSGSGSDGGTTPAMITVSGEADTVSGTTQTGQAGVVLTAYKQSDDTQLATATSGTGGAFSMSIATGGSPIAVYIKGTNTGDLDTYVYPPAPLSSNTSNVPVLLITGQTRDTLTGLITNGGQTQTGSAWIGVEVVDATGAPITGATISSNPMGSVNYDGPSGFPAGGNGTTAADGRAYDVNVTAGDLSISAAKTGTTFATHTIKARPDVITLTSVVGQ